MTILNSLFDDYILDKTSIAIGFFDGVHLGHSKVISLTKSGDYKSCIFTFPKMNSNKDSVLPILSEKQRLDKFRMLDVDYVICPPFPEFCHMSSEEFLKTLYNDFGAREICGGENLKIGKNARSDVDNIRQLCTKIGITLKTAAPVFYKNERISSTRIRCALQQNDIDAANKMLGYDYNSYAKKFS